MTTHTAQRTLVYPCECMFDLVADVERYPEFLPFWQAAKIFHRKGNVYHTEQEISIGLMRERFRTKTVLHHPRRIEVTSSEGLFRHLAIHWDFQPTPDGGCRVDFVQSWETHSILVGALLDMVLMENAHTTMSAFEKRAHALYDADAVGSSAFAD